MSNQMEAESRTRSTSDSFRTYLTDSERSVLRPHQYTVFEDMQKFFEEGHTRGYISLPTGTGKTVLFVELSKVLLDVAPEQKKPKILVVTPSKDLVHQTMGKSGERGYGRFAPELGVGSYFSDTPQSEKQESGFLENDVVVTTYDSFGILNETADYKHIPVEHVIIPHVKIPQEKIARIKIPTDDLDKHKSGHFSDEILNSQLYIRMVDLLGEDVTIKRIKNWKEYPQPDELFFNSEIYKQMVSLFGEKETLKRIKRWKTYPLIEGIGLFESEIYKQMVNFFGEKVAMTKIKQWNSYPLIDGIGLYESEIYKQMVSLFGEKETMTKIRSWQSYPKIDDLLKSDFFKKIVFILGKKEAIETANIRRSFPVKTGGKLLDNFDIFLLDEAHHVFGETVAKLVEEIPNDKKIIGFTATPKADKLRDLENYLPYKIHDLDLLEAINIGLLAPILPVSLRSGLKIEGSDIFDEKGEYIDSKISYLAHDENRNKIVINAAKSMTAHDRGIIISCIAGGDAWHAKHLAEMLKTAGLRAEAIYYAVPAPIRQKIYDKFNKGEIDVLTYIGVLGEGWDSQRAKVIINARPTRSDIVAKQRLGRITRQNGQLAVAIDIMEDFDPQNPPVTVADALESGDVEFGKVIGPNTDTSLQKIIEDLRINTPVQELLKAPFSVFKDQLASLPQLKNGFTMSSRGYPEYAIVSRINRQFMGLTSEILEKIGVVRGIQIDKQIAAQERSVREVYHIEQARRLLAALPTVEPNKYFVDDDNQKWISASGMLLLFSKRFSGLTQEVLDQSLDAIQGEIEWIPASYRIKSNRDRLMSLIKLFKADQDTIKKISSAISITYS